MVMLDTADWTERRATARLPVRLDAKLFPGDRACEVKDFSLKGARVQLSDASQSPDEVVLVLWASGQAFEAQAVWWNGDEIGLRFIRSCDLAQPVPLTFRESKQAWQAARSA